MNFIEHIHNGTFNDILAELTDSATLNLQTVGISKGKDSALELLQKQQEYLKDEIKEVKIFREFEDRKHRVVEYDILLQNTFDLPLAVVMEKAGNKYSAIRTYHSVYPITEGHIFRASIFSEEIELAEPEEVVKYFKGIALGSTEAAMETLSFEDDVYFREPAGWRWNHKTEKGLKAHFDHFFSDGGVPLRFHNYIFDKEKGTFAGEYTCDVWGSAVFKPQAGVSIYDINTKTGKITGIRVYDNVDANYK